MPSYPRGRGSRARPGTGRSSTIVRELERDPEVLLAEKSDRGLQVVLLLPRHADLLSLDRHLHLELGVLDGADDLLGLLRRDSLEDLDVLPDRSLRGGLDGAVFQSLERDAALGELRLQEVVDRLQPELVVR